MKKIKLSFVFLLIISFPLHAQDYTIFEENGHYGVKSRDNILKAQYDRIYPIHGSPDYVLTEDGETFSLYNVKQAILYRTYTYFYDFLEGDSCYIPDTLLIRMEYNKKLGLFHFPDKPVIKPEYDFIWAFGDRDTVFLLEKDDQYALYFYKKDYQTPWFYLKYPEYVFNFDDFYIYPEIYMPFAAKINDNWHIIYWTGKTEKILNIDQKDEIFFADNYYDALPVDRKGKVGFIDIYGNPVSEFIYEDARPMIGGYGPAKINGKWGLCEFEYGMSIPAVYDAVKININTMEIIVKNGSAEAKTDEYGNPYYLDVPVYNSRKGKYGYRYIGKRKTAIPFIFDGARDFSDGVAAVNKGGKNNPDYEDPEGGKWGFILPTGKLIIDYQFDEVDYFDAGRVRVVKDGREYYINIYGEEVK